MGEGILKLDEVIDTRVLSNADEVIGITGLDRREAEGRVYGAIEGEHRHKIRMPPDGDLRPFDQFNVWIYASGGAKGSISIMVNLNTTTEGMAFKDRYSSGVPTKIDWVGWKECVFPFENFLIFGCPEGWVDVEDVTITVAPGTRHGIEDTEESRKGVLGIGDVGMVHRKRVEGPRLTDEGLFEVLNLEYPDMEKVKSAVADGDLETAKTELLTYYLNRPEAYHSFDPNIEIDPTYDRTEADRICDHFIQNQQLPKEFDWRINPIGYLEWMHALNRHFFMTTLTDAYKKTGDEKYAKELDYLLRTFLDQNPEPVDHNGGGDPAWETLSTSCRGRRVWLDIWYKLKDSPSLKPETRIDMLKSFYAHAEHLFRYEGFRNNWFIVESEMVAVLGVIFPEFKRAETWKTRGYERLSIAIAEQVFPDGTQYEISAGYHSMSGSGFELPYQLAKDNGLPVDPLLEERLEGMFQYTAYTARPDFTHPSINDSGGVGGGSAAWALNGGELFDRDDLRWIGTKGERGSIPDHASHAFEDSGIYVMRSGWDPDAKYLIMDAGAYSAAHQHEDKLSFEIAYGSDPLIVDPGIASYMPEPWTEYYKHTRSHNTVIIDGGGQISRETQTWADWVGSVREENRVQMGKGLDYAISQYDAGYEGVLDKVVHQRAILFVRNDYYLLFDRVSGKGAHTVEALFQFMPVRVHVDGNRVRTDREGLRNIELAPLNLGTNFRPSLVTGQNNPVQGWISNRENMPAPCAIYRKKGAELPVEFGCVMVPFSGGGRSANLKIRRVKVQSGNAFKLSWPDRTSDLIFWRWNAQGDAEFGPYSTDGHGAIVRKTRGGKITYAAAVDGSYLKGKELALLGRGLVES